MALADLLTTAGVPAELHPQALASLALAKERIGWLNVSKFWVRWFKAGTIAGALQWEDERLLERCPERAAWDIAPVLNVTAQGDNLPWVETPEGGRPAPGQWLDRDPQSAQYQQAVAANYWCPGEHPRSSKSRKAWYRRNACEFTAWQRGMPVDVEQGIQEWSNGGVTILRCGDAWQLTHRRRLLGSLMLVTCVGFEVGNVFACINGRWVQSWYPVPGYELRAPVTWSTLPELERD